MSKQKQQPPLDPWKSIRINAAVGLGLVVLVCGGLGGWAATTEISGALIAQGSVVVETDVKKVQHPSGGVVGALFVRNGDTVKAGDILVKLDETMMRANLAIVVNALVELAGRAARLESERDGRAEVDFPADFLARRSDPPVERVITAERRLFELRNAARVGQKRQLEQRVAQFEDEIRGQTAQHEAKGREIELIQRELEGVRELWSKNLVQLTRLTALEREATRLEGERAALIAAMAQTRGKIAETRLQILQIDQTFASDVGKELREIDGKTSEYAERKVAAEDQLKRVDIRAPQDGVVHELAVHTVGGVVGPGEQIMVVVPSNDALTIEAKVTPVDIDQLWIGQKASLRFTAFNARTTPEIDGAVSRISANTTTDQRSGATFYTVRISIPPSELARLGEVRLVPGMIVETFVKTTDRTVASYLVKPLSDQVMRAFRER